MTTTLETAQDKLKQICSVLRDETIEPAKRQAENIIADAQKQADQLLAEARLAAKNLIDDARNKMDQERDQFRSSMQNAARQCLETLRQSIESKFFNEQLEALLREGTQNVDVVAGLINAVITAITKEGLSADITAIVPKTILPKEINNLLLKDVLKVLKEQGVVSGNLLGGAKIKLNDKQMTIDISQDALKELLASHVVRRDFRKLLFAE